MSKSECRKFMPNIFNKTKCASCFKAKDEHSDAALESNRASRKIAKCGYLFVAPDWDFSNPINRTKRWQRRWFVLYDDGELTYSVDEHPETVPQAIIDMNRVVEVSEAEEVTGHPFSLALTAADRVHFLKGTSREESKWWFDILSMFPRTNIKSGRHKRNATFPGGKATTIPSHATTAPSSPNPGIVVQPYHTPPLTRPRFHSCRTEPLDNSVVFPSAPVKDNDKDKENVEDVIPVRDTSDNGQNPVPDKDVVILDKENELDKYKSRRVVKRDIRGARSARCNSEILTSMLLPTMLHNQQTLQQPNNKAYAVVLPTSSSGSTSVSVANSRVSVPERPRSMIYSPTPSRSSGSGSASAHGSLYLYMTDVPKTRQYESMESLRHERVSSLSQTQLRHSSVEDNSSKSQSGNNGVEKASSAIAEAVRGDPDGCGLDPVLGYCSPLAGRRLASISTLVAEDLSSVKKGCLMRFTVSEEWVKRWVVLRGSLFSCFRDQSSEETENPEEVFDFKSIVSIEEAETGRSYGFAIVADDGKKYNFAALTHGIRSQWMQSLRNAINQYQGKCEQLTSSSPVGRNEASGIEISPTLDTSPHDTQVNGKTTLTLPPSPLLNKTPMSRVKERSRSRSSSRSRRHSVSPNSPRRSPVETPPPLVPAAYDPADQKSPRLEAVKSDTAEMVQDRRENDCEVSSQVSVLAKKLLDNDQLLVSLQYSLEATKKENLQLKQKLDEKEVECRKLRDESDIFISESQSLKESLKSERSEVYKLRDVVKELRSLLDTRNDTLQQLQRKTDETKVLQMELNLAKSSLKDTQSRLQQGIEENEILSNRLRLAEDSRGGSWKSHGSNLRRSRSSTGSMPLPLQLCNSHLSCSSKKSLSRLDSLSDLSNIDYDLDLESLDKESVVDEYVGLRTRFEKAISEIRALKRELKQAQAACDSVEVAHMALKQQWQAKEVDYVNQLTLMAARVQDLTTKLTNSEKLLRQMKQKVIKNETKERRRTQSLKGRESFQLSKEIEDKLVELEKRLNCKDGESPKSVTPQKSKKGFEDTTKSFRLRRKSLEGGNSGDAVKVLLRVEALEQQVTGGKSPPRRNSLPKSPQGKPPKAQTSTKLKRSDSQTSTNTDVCSLQPIGDVSKALEHCLLELEMLNQGQMTNVIAGIKDALRLLAGGSQSKRDLPDNETGLDAIDRVQEFLRSRLADLKMKRDRLRNSGKLDSTALNEIAAEKLALEVSTAEQLYNQMNKSAQGLENGEVLEDAHWTITKIRWLKNKIVGKSVPGAIELPTVFSSSLNSLAERFYAVMSLPCGLTSGNSSEQVVPVSQLPSGIVDQLALEERELNTLFAKHKEAKLGELAKLLALETLRMGESNSDNQLVEEVKMREAWLQAQEVANKELVESEVRQAMMRLAEVFAEDVAAEEKFSNLLALWPAQQVLSEKRCRLVEDILRQEMEEAVLLLSNQYERYLQELRASEEPLPLPDADVEVALSDFAEIVAQKALAEGHVAVLQGESTPSLPAASQDDRPTVVQCVGAIQQTENLTVVSDGFFGLAIDAAEVAALLHRMLSDQKSTNCSQRTEDSSATVRKLEAVIQSLQSGEAGEMHSLSDQLSEEYQQLLESSSRPQIEESIRQRYQMEIEQLRELTEKGMATMESSHKRIIAEMEEKHRQEMARLQVEKERALAEETQATLAALDAMRKAHEAEVQREIARFKEEFLQQMAVREESVHQHESEMNNVRREILSLSEKYSRKCLESAALEQKVSSLGQQLAVAHRRISDLDKRNQLLRNHLDSELQQPDSSAGEQLKLQEGQLLTLQEDIAELQYLLREAQAREEELSSLARQLGQFLRTDRPLTHDEVASVRPRLEELLILSGPGSRRNSAVDDERSKKADTPPRDLNRFSYARRKELMRSPSCPRLSGLLSLGPRLSSRSVLRDNDSNA